MCEGGGGDQRIKLNNAEEEEGEEGKAEALCESKLGNTPHVLTCTSCTA